MSNRNIASVNQPEPATLREILQRDSGVHRNPQTGSFLITEDAYKPRLKLCLEKTTQDVLRASNCQADIVVDLDAITGLISLENAANGFRSETLDVFSEPYYGKEKIQKSIKRMKFEIELADDEDVFGIKIATVQTNSRPADLFLLVPTESNNCLEFVREAVKSSLEFHCRNDQQHHEAAHTRDILASIHTLRATLSAAGIRSSRRKGDFSKLPVPFSLAKCFFYNLMRELQMSDLMNNFYLYYHSIDTKLSNVCQYPVDLQVIRDIVEKDIAPESFIKVFIDICHQVTIKDTENNERLMCFLKKPIARRLGPRIEEYPLFLTADLCNFHRHIWNASYLLQKINIYSAVRDKLSCSGTTPVGFANYGAQFLDFFVKNGSKNLSGFLKSLSESAECKLGDFLLAMEKLPSEDIPLRLEFTLDLDDMAAFLENLTVLLPLDTILEDCYIIRVGDMSEYLAQLMSILTNPIIMSIGRLRNGITDLPMLLTELTTICAFEGLRTNFFFSGRLISLDQGVMMGSRTGSLNLKEKISMFNRPFLALDVWDSSHYRLKYSNHFSQEFLDVAKKISKYCSRKASTFLTQSLNNLGIFLNGDLETCSALVLRQYCMDLAAYLQISFEGEPEKILRSTFAEQLGLHCPKNDPKELRPMVQEIFDVTKLNNIAWQKPYLFALQLLSSRFSIPDCLFEIENCFRRSYGNVIHKVGLGNQFWFRKTMVKVRTEPILQIPMADPRPSRPSNLPSEVTSSRNDRRSDTNKYIWTLSEMTLLFNLVNRVGADFRRILCQADASLFLRHLRSSTNLRDKWKAMTNSKNSSVEIGEGLGRYHLNHERLMNTFLNSLSIHGKRCTNYEDALTDAVNYLEARGYPIYPLVPFLREAGLNIEYDEIIEENEGHTSEVQALSIMDVNEELSNPENNDSLPLNDVFIPSQALVVGNADQTLENETVPILEAQGFGSDDQTSLEGEEMRATSSVQVPELELETRGVGEDTLNLRVNQDRIQKVQSYIREKINTNDIIGWSGIRNSLWASKQRPTDEEWDSILETMINDGYVEISHEKKYGNKVFVKKIGP